MPLAAVLHNLCSRYAKWFNRRYSRTGHLFERRYRARLIETEESACRLIRYIHLNPVRAGLVCEPAVYPWSSHGTYVGTAKTPWLETRWILRLFGDSREQARRGLERYISEGLAEEVEVEQAEDLAQLLVEEEAPELTSVRVVPIRGATKGPPVWRLAQLEDLLQVITALEGSELSELGGRSQNRTIARARALSAYFAKQCRDLTIAEVARALGRDPSTLGRAADGIAKRLEIDSGLKRRVELTREHLTGAVLRRK